MRILAIRGQNLASLRAFEVDLEALEAQGGSLFAITGPTGAGKSTLLDALCLALFDRTPRLSDRGGATIGLDPEHEGNLAANDQRAILRRGAGAGFAEVDFTGQDGGHYRARWSVRRAHKRANARFQNQKISLVDLADGEKVLHAETKTATLNKIQELVGLSFDQFRRSVLLAQGEFDAFLRAEAKDRGALLERMTGTEIYRQLSRGAHERHREAKQQLAIVEARGEGQKPLRPDARDALTARGEAAHGWLQAAAARRSSVEEMVAWHQRAATLGEKRVAAETELRVARAAHAAAAPRREALERAHALGPWRGPLEAADAAARRLARAEADRIEKAKAAAARADALTSADETARAADAAHRAAVGAEAGARDDLRAARRLDEQVERHVGAATDAVRLAMEALREAQAAEQALAEQRRRLAAHQEIIAAAEAWQTDHPVAGALATEAGRWREALRSWAAAVATDRAARSAKATADRALGDARAALGATGAAEAADDAASDALRALELARQAADANPLAQAHKRADHAREALSRVEALQALVADAERVREQQRALRVRAQAARGESRFAQAAASTDRERARVLRGQLGEAERALRLAQSVRDLEAHRATLTPGAPCPLCGSREHPGVSTAAGLADTQEARVKDLRQTLSAVDRAIAKAEAEAEAAEARARAADADAEQRDQRRAAIADAWTMKRFAVAGADLPDDPLDALGRARLSALLDEAREALAIAEARVETAQTHHEAVRQADIAEKAARAQARALGQAAHAAQKAVEAAAREAERGAVEADRCAAARATLEVSLAGPLGDPGWASAVTDPEGFVAARFDDIEAWHAQHARRAVAEAAVQREREPEVRAAARAVAATERSIARTAQADAAEADLTAARAQRAALLGGRDTDEVEAELAAAVHAAEVGREAQRSAREEAAKAAEAAEARLEAADAAVERAQEEHGAATAALEPGLKAFAVDADGLRAALTAAPTDLAAEQQALKALGAAVDKAQAVVEERQADLTAHAGGRPDLDADAAQRALAQATEAVEGFREVEVGVRVQLHADDQAREAVAALVDDLAAARAEVARWKALDDIIGSSSGHAFSSFAQSLTLEAVIEQANGHLDALARRYQLMRVPLTDLELQVVDRDMGEEIRPIRSLSGGESFLVSLALALGLANLAARDIRLQSLFIDEGFGTLDDASLEIVLASLEALQADERQVGIISHVPGLAERMGAEVMVRPRVAGLSEVEVRTFG